MPASDRAVELTVAAARAAADLKADEIIALDVSEQLVLTDAFLIASGTNERQVGAIVDAVEEALHKLGAKPLRREGKQQGRWVLIDFGEVVVHVQHAEDRVFYALERLWKDCPVIELPADVRAGSGQTEQAEGQDAAGSPE
ncbi:ribosome silencing factor [Cellulomonas hominis]